MAATMAEDQTNERGMANSQLLKNFAYQTAG